MLLAEDAATISWMANLAYVLAGLLFALALHDFSRQNNGRRGHIALTIGMAITIAATLCAYSAAALPQLFIALAIGGGAGFVGVQRVALPMLPRLIMGFHALVGITAMAVGMAAWVDPSAFGIPFDISRTYCPDVVGADSLPCAVTAYIRPASAALLAIGWALGAISFTGSIVMGSKGGGIPAGRAPGLAPSRPAMGARIFPTVVMVAILSLIVLFAVGYQTAWVPSGIMALSALTGVLLIRPTGRADLPGMLAMLNSVSGWATAVLGFAMDNMAMVIAGGLAGSAGATLCIMSRRRDSGEGVVKGEAGEGMHM